MANKNLRDSDAVIKRYFRRALARKAHSTEGRKFNLRSPSKRSMHDSPDKVGPREAFLTKLGNLQHRRHAGLITCSKGWYLNKHGKPVFDGMAWISSLIFRQKNRVTLCERVISVENIDSWYGLIMKYGGFWTCHFIAQSLFTDELFCLHYFDLIWWTQLTNNVSSIVIIRGDYHSLHNRFQGVLGHGKDGFYNQVGVSSWNNPGSNYISMCLVN